MLTDILKEKLSSKFFLLLIKKRKTLPFFGGGEHHYWAIGCAFHRGWPSEDQARCHILIGLTLLLHNGGLPVRRKGCLMSAEFKFLP